MTMSEKKSLASAEGLQVADYLRRHPEFFNHHPDVLAFLQLPHNAGGAVSLVERQQLVLRERNSELRNRLDELMATSKTNDQLFAKSRALVLSLIAATSKDDIFTALHRSFGGEFATEHYSLTLVDGSGRGPGVHSRSLNELQGQLAAVLDSDTPVCGVLRPQQLTLLFGDKARELGSAVAIRLVTDRVYGILALGSADSHYYHSGMDTLFLRFIADVLNLVLYPRL